MILSPGGFVHGTAIALGARGLLIRGRSKAGKSVLALGLIRLAGASGQEALLVGDDRIGIRADDGQLEMAPHPAIAGLIACRDRGILPVPHRGTARLCLILELQPMPETADAAPDIVLGIPVPRLIFSERPHAEDVLPLVLAALAK